MKRIVSLITALVLFITSAAVFPAYAAEDSHVIINQVYGASDDGYAGPDQRQVVYRILQRNLRSKSQAHRPV